MTENDQNLPKHYKNWEIHGLWPHLPQCSSGPNNKVAYRLRSSESKGVTYKLGC